MDELTERERAVLDFERDWLLRGRGKQRAITARFDITPSRYRQILAGLLDRPAARAHDPLLVARLRRRRDQRRGTGATVRADQRGRGWSG